MNTSEDLDSFLRHLENLKPLEGLSPLSISILGLTKKFADLETCNFASYGKIENAMHSWRETMENLKVNCTAGEIEALDLSLELLYTPDKVRKAFYLSLYLREY